MELSGLNLEARRPFGRSLMAAQERDPVLWIRARAVAMWELDGPEVPFVSSTTGTRGAGWRMMCSSLPFQASWYGRGVPFIIRDGLRSTNLG